MIELVTLVLGLTLGIHEVEVAVGPDVAAVHWILDGKVVAQTSGPPWRERIDFGDTLVPHRLTVLAVDEGGRPLDTAEQLINYIRAGHEVVIVLRERQGRKIGGRLVVHAVMDEEPESLTLKLDGRPLELDAYGGFRLPEYDPEHPHALEAEARFSGEAVARAESTFGGGLGEELTSALSAVAVTSPLRRPWSAEEVEGWLRHRGHPLPVFDSRADGSRVVVVRDDGLIQDLARHQRFMRFQRTPQEELLPAGLYVAGVSSRPLQDHPSTFEISDLGLAPPTFGLMQIFLGRPEIYAFDRSLGSTQPQDLWTAVAVAGRMAAASNLPRVVVLLLGPEPSMDGGMTRQTVVTYLESIQVPLLIWAPSNKSLKKAGLHGLENTFVGPRGLYSVADLAAKTVESQTLIWIEGTFLPTEIELVADRAKARPVSSVMLRRPGA